MSSKRGDRRHRTECVIAKRKKQIKEIGGAVKHYHSLSKTGPMTCGNSNCVNCGNPRKFYNEPTIQEKRAFQKDQD